MPANDREVAMFFLAGLSEREQSTKIHFDDGTINFYPTLDGYLINYPGKVDLFVRDAGYSAPDTNFRADPPSISNEYTRVASFTDFLGVDHIVFVEGPNVRTVEGNGSRILYTLTGVERDGKYFPTLFIHDGKMVIVNQGDIPLIWDGVDSIQPLGVNEVPTPPWVEIMDPLGGYRFSNNPYGWKNRSYYGDEYVPAYTQDAGATAGARYDTKLRCQFVDRYGNKGRASTPSPVQFCPNIDAGQALSGSWTNPAGTYGDEHRLVMTIVWDNPKVDHHVTGDNVGRTGQLKLASAAPIGTPSIYYIEHAQLNTAQARHTSKLSDASLVLQSVMDLDVTPPPSASIGCSWAGRVFLVSDDNMQVRYSDLGFFGQFRATQELTPYSHATALVPAGDRLFVIGETSTEVFYEQQTTGLIARLEQDIENGSMYGSSFVAVGDGAVFGLWNKGFGFYDGVDHKFVNEPYYIRSIYMDNTNFIHNAIVIDNWYYLVIRKDHISSENNVIIMYNFAINQWYVIGESLWDLCSWNEEIIGVDNSVYVLFRGDTFPDARFVTVGLSPDGLGSNKTLKEMRILMEPSSIAEVRVDVRSEDRFTARIGQGTAYPSTGQIQRRTYPHAHWNHPKHTWEEEPKWLAPGDFWMVPYIEQTVSGMSHVIDVTFGQDDSSQGHPVRIKALGLVYTQPSKPPTK